MYKIGRSIDPAMRMVQLGGTPRTMGVVHTIALGSEADSRELERYLHVTFGEHRRHGEWFRLPEEDVTLFKTIPAVAAESDIPAAVRERYARRTSMPPRKAFNVSYELSAALAAYVATLKPERPESGVLRLALEILLERRGFWPPKAD